MRFVVPVLLGLVPTTALAENVPNPFQEPAEVTMFESIRIVTAKGKVKKGTCKEAAAAALADAEDNARRKTHATLIALYGERPKHGNWEPPAELYCEVKGKNSIVKAEALAIRLGSGDAYMNVTPQRVREIADAVIADGMMVQLQLQAFNVEDYKGQLYYRTVGMSRSDEQMFTKRQNRNTRAVMVYREHITPAIESLASLVEPVNEISGIHVSVSAKRMNKKDEVKTERFHLYVPTQSALGFAAGDITEQELINSGSFLYANGTSNPVKMDISFIDADD